MLQIQLVGPAYSFLPCLVVLAICVVLMAMLLPETRNRSIEDISDEFRRRSRSMSVFTPRSDSVERLLAESSELLKAATEGDMKTYGTAAGSDPMLVPGDLSSAAPARRSARLAVSIGNRHTPTSVGMADAVNADGGDTLSTSQDLAASC